MKTLYDDLRACESITAELDFFPTGSYTFEVGRHLAEARTIAVRNAKRRIVREYCESSPLIKSVYDGRRTFAEIGKSIIEHAERLEEKLNNGEIRKVKKQELLGRDARDNLDVREIVDSLKENKIINPDNFFSTVRNIPNSSLGKITGRIINKYPSIIIPAVLIPSFASALYFVGCSDHWYIHGSGVDEGNFKFGGFFIGTAICTYSGILKLFDMTTGDPTQLTKQKNNFSNALKFLDTEFFNFN